MATFTHIRDSIIIDSDLTALLDQTSLPPGSTVSLIARQIVHFPKFVLSLPGVNVVLVGDSYDANGGKIIVSGVRGGAGSVGSDGADATQPFRGESGGHGSPGTGGSPGGSVRLICQRMHSAHFVANGGSGGPGGVGGAGGAGAPAVQSVSAGGARAVTGNGRGGSGAAGGPGGRGGRVEVICVRADTDAVLESKGGPGAPGGTGGGSNDDGDGPEARKAGPAGPTGPSGQAVTTVVTAETYAALVREALGAAEPATTAPNETAGPYGRAVVTAATTDSYAPAARDARRAAAPAIPAAARSILDQWIEHRFKVGEYHYRRYQPGVGGDREREILTAQEEFNAILQLDPFHAEVPRLKKQIEANLNILGLPWQMDLIPDFKDFEDQFTAWGSLVFSTFEDGISKLLTSTVIEELKHQMDLEVAKFLVEVENIGGDIKIAEAARDAATKEFDDAQTHRNAIEDQITAAKSEMAHHSMTFGEVVGDVAAVATAVVAVAGSVFSGGASLVALAPAVLSLGKDLLAKQAEIGAELFKQEQPNVDRVKAEYAKVNGDVTKVIAAEKAVVNLVDVIQKLGTGQDDTKYVALLQRAVEATHALGVAQMHKSQAEMALQVVQAKQERAKKLLEDARALAQQEGADLKALRNGGLSVIRRVQSRMDPGLLTFAFLAARSVEIYTLKPEVQNVFFDAGFIHPDTESAFVDKTQQDSKLAALSAIDFINKYSDSFHQLLQPEMTSADITNFFNPAQGGPRIGALRLSFTDPDVIANFQSSHDLPFAVNLADLPPDHPEAKVLAAAVSFVGASSNSGTISCEVRHGPRYDSKLRSGIEWPLVLQQRIDTTLAGTTPLQPPPVSFNAKSITETTVNPLFGRGVGGPWGVSIPQFEFDHERVDLTHMTEMQVWIGYVFMAIAG
jgi:hypothetical protein